MFLAFFFSLANTVFYFIRQLYVKIKFVNTFKSFLTYFFQSFYDRAKIGVEKLVERVGFLGILACASVSIFLTFWITYCHSKKIFYFTNVWFVFSGIYFRGCQILSEKKINSINMYI